MKRLFLLALLVASGTEARDRRCHSTRPGSRLANSCDSVPLLSAFTRTGAGVTTPCSTTAPTGTKGETLTFSRASSATCTKTATGGLATTGIADGDLVTLSSNQPRIEYDNSGLLGLRLEAAGTNLLLRSDALTNAAWSDVGTPTVTDGATDPFGGTTGDTIEDDDGADFEGRSQSVTVSSGAAYFMHCYVKAGTATKARISIDGTTQDASLDAVTWTIVEKGDASSSSTSIEIQVLVGNAAGDTGTVIWGGCDVKAGTYRTSYVPTAGATVARATEGTPTFPFVAANGSTVALAVTVTTNFIPTTGTTLATPPASGNPSLLGRFSGGNFGCYQMTPAADLAAGTWAVGANRWACSTARMAHLRGTTATASASTVTATLATLGFGSTGGFGAAVDGIYSNLCGDVGSYTRCQP